MKESDLLEKTKQLSLESTYRIYKGKPIRVAAALYRGSELICCDTNKRKSHPLQEKYNKFVPYNKSCNLHAELATIILANKKLDKDEVKRTTLYIARKLNTEGFGGARPCPACMAAIRDFGIRKIVYTTDDGYAVETIQ